uniref:Uncharacterized protein n=1 Tax=Glossina austeni TaxID=7395 RepID=A0A1A9UCQ6_GLOAU
MVIRASRIGPRPSIISRASASPSNFTTQCRTLSMTVLYDMVACDLRLVVMWHETNINRRWRFFYMSLLPCCFGVCKLVLVYWYLKLIQVQPDEWLHAQMIKAEKKKFGIAGMILLNPLSTEYCNYDNCHVFWAIILEATTASPNELKGIISSLV